MSKEWDTEFSIKDTMNNIGSAGVGKMLGWQIMDVLTERGVPIQPSETFILGLGAGVGHQEVGLAHTLEIPNQNITLLDKYFPNYTREAISLNYPQVEVVENGIFSFFEQNPSAKRFSVVTGFSIEYILSKPERFQKFISGLSKIMSPNGISVIGPSPQLDMHDVWIENGFEAIKRYKSSIYSVIYIFQPS